MNASDELQAAASAIRVSTTPGASQIADLLEETARMARISEGVWQLAGYSAEKQAELAESKWRRELAVARALGRKGR
ncbi:MAG: hypothetical protein M3460_09965 [Actinomycetota bacterium]|nr:hypothetical protein [Actinomycetota bacterium]